MPRVMVQSAVLRVTAGAEPGRTQQLLNRSLNRSRTRLPLICGKGEYLNVNLLKN